MMAKRLFLSVIIAIIGLSSAACGGTPPPSVPVTHAIDAPTNPDQRGTPPPTLTPVTWREASAPISLQNIESIALLGRLNTEGIESTVFHYALSPDNTQLVGLNNTLLVAWDLISGKQIFATSRQDAIQVYYSPNKDEVFTLTAQGGLYIIQSDKGSYGDSITGHHLFNNVQHYHAQTGLMALGGTDGAIHVWDLPNRTQRALLPNPSGEPIDLQFSNNAKHIVATYRDGSVLVWDWASEAILNVLVPPSELVYAVRFSQDGQAVMGISQRIGFIWDVVSGNLHHAINIESGGTQSLYFKIFGDFAIIAGITPSTHIWNITTGRQVATLQEVGNNDLDIALSPDGKMLISSVYEQGVTLWNLQNINEGAIGRSSFVFENTDILELAWTVDSYLILMFDASGAIEVWGIPAA